MDHPQQLRLPPLLLLSWLLYYPLSKGFEEIDPSANRTDTDNHTLMENSTTVWTQCRYFSVSLCDNFSRSEIWEYAIDSLAFSWTLRELPIYITAVSITSLSIIASMTLLITYSLFRTLRTFPSYVIMSLAAAFLGRDVCYIVRASLVYSNKAGIWSIGVLSLVELYFFYTRFMWMALAGFEMSRNIYSGIKLKFVSQSEKKKLFIVYVLLGWGVPLLLDAIVAAMVFSDSKTFFEIGINFIILVPVGITLLFNIGIVIFLSFMLHNAAARRKRIMDNVKRHNTIFVRVFLVILSVLGLPWVLLFLLLIRRVHVDLLAIFHILMNMSQPLVVSIAFIGTKKVIQKYLGLCGYKLEDKKINTKVISGRQKRAKRLLSPIIANRNSARQQEKEKGENNKARHEDNVITMCVTNGVSSNSD